MYSALTMRNYQTAMQPHLPQGSAELDKNNKKNNKNYNKKGEVSLGLVNDD